jgi:ERCC4-related helicase
VRCNTLVALPTGLGKTAIAASSASTLLSLSHSASNPSTKAIFLAPTRPLALQLAREVRLSAGWSRRQCFTLTGANKKASRQAPWHDSTIRAVFATSKAFANDASRGVVPNGAIAVAVIDEVHHCTGQHPHALALRHICTNSPSARLIGLSASPGKDGKSVQVIIDALQASRVEARCESDPHVKPYCHDTAVEVKRVREAMSAKSDASNSEQARDLLLDELRPVAKELHSRGLMQCREPPTDDWLLNASPYVWLQMRRSTGPGQHQKQFGIAQTLGRSLQALQRYGPAAAVSEVHKALRKNKTLAGRAKVEEAQVLLEKAHSEGVQGSPKLEVAVEVVREHIQRVGSRNSRVMVFTSRRESVTDTVRALRSVRGARPLPFVGQATAASGTDGMKQEEQSSALHAFRTLERNILVATSVAEEGLDVANVDLAVIFDSVGARRIAQRMGRAGRARDGRVVALAGENKEASSFESDMDHQIRILTRLASAGGTGFSFQLAPLPEHPVVPPEAEVLVSHTKEPEDADEEDIGEAESTAGRSRPFDLSPAEQVSKILHGIDPQWRADVCGQVYRLQRPSKTAMVPHSNFALVLTQTLMKLRSNQGWPGGRPNTVRPDEEDVSENQNRTDQAADTEAAANTDSAHKCAEGNREAHWSQYEGNIQQSLRCWILEGEMQKEQQRKCEAMEVANNIPAFAPMYSLSNSYVNISKDGELHVAQPPREIIAELRNWDKESEWSHEEKGRRRREASDDENALPEEEHVSSETGMPAAEREQMVQRRHSQVQHEDDQGNNYLQQRQMRPSSEGDAQMSITWASKATEKEHSGKRGVHWEENIQSHEAANAGKIGSSDAVDAMDEVPMQSEPETPAAAQIPHDQQRPEADHTPTFPAEHVAHEDKRQELIDAQRMPPAATTPSSSIRHPTGSKIGLGRKRKLSSSDPSPVPFRGLSPAFNAEAATDGKQSLEEQNAASGFQGHTIQSYERCESIEELGNKSAHANGRESVHRGTGYDVGEPQASTEKGGERKRRRESARCSETRKKTAPDNAQIAKDSRMQQKRPMPGSADKIDQQKQNRKRKRSSQREKCSLESSPRSAKPVRQPQSRVRRLIDDEAEAEDGEAESYDDDDRSALEGSFVVEDASNEGENQLGIYREAMLKTPESTAAKARMRSSAEGRGREQEKTPGSTGMQPSVWYSQPEPASDDIEEDEDLADFIVQEDGENENCRDGSSDGLSAWEDVCRKCSEYGELLLCDSCPAAYHPACAQLPDARIPGDDAEWYCPTCEASRA